LVSAELFLSHSVTPLSRLLLPHSFFCPFLKDVITEALQRSPIVLALVSGGSVLELAGICSIRHGGNFYQHLIEATPIATPLPKPCHTNPQHWEIKSFPALTSIIFFATALEKHKASELGLLLLPLFQYLHCFIVFKTTLGH